MNTTTSLSLLGAPMALDLNDRRPRLWGWLLLIVGLGLFMVWATLAPLDGAVPAQGTVAVSGSRKLVQPLVGGKVAEIKVRDGAKVTAGDLLVRLDDTSSRSQLDVVRGQWMAAVAVQSRLLTEQKDSGSLDFSPELMELGKDARVVEAMEIQSRLLQSRRQMRQAEMRALQASLQALEFQLQGIEASRLSKETQGRLLREEIRNQRALSEEGYYPRNRISEQERTLVALIGSTAEDTGAVGKLRQNIAELRARITNREQEIRRDIDAQLADTQREVAALESRMKGLEYEVANAQVLAPVDGTVMSLSLHTVGGVVTPGAVLMEVMPLKEPLVIEVQLAPTLIDKVKPGMNVDLLFTAFNQATTPRVEGRVVSVSPDAQADSRQNNSYFKLMVEVAPEALVKLRQHEVRAGMPVEVFIKTGERTFMSYLLKPLLDRMNHALIEP